MSEIEQHPQVSGAAITENPSIAPEKAAPEKARENVVFWVRIVVTILILVVAIVIVFMPNFSPAPAPRVILFLLVAMLPAILIGAEATTKFEFKLPGFLFTTGGTMAAVVGILMLLSHLAKPEEQIAVFSLVDEQDQDLKLGWKGAVEVETTSKGITVTHFVEGNTLILIFPEQAPTVTLKVRKNFDGAIYRGNVSYTGSRSTNLKLGKELITSGL
jgi:hypothetical protein